MKCTECNFDYGDRKEDFNFCPKCAVKLPEMSHLSLEAWKRVELSNSLLALTAIVSPGLVGAGIALWIMAPTWFDFTETYTIRKISAGLMVGGVLIFAAWFAFDRWATRVAVRLAQERSNNKPANIYLLLDVSTSMEGKNLRRVKEASESFLSQMDEEHDHLGLISFSGSVTDVYPLTRVNKSKFGSGISGLEAYGNTALYDAVVHAVKRIKKQWDPERNNVVIAMTDGQDNVSERGIADIQSLLADEDKPVFVFTVAYGWSADKKVLREIAESGRGQVFSANGRTIKKLYQLLSAFF